MNTKEKIDFSVRQCRYEEIPQVIAINEITLPENYPLFFYEQIYQSFPKSFLVAEVNDHLGKRLVGYIMWRCESGISSFGVNLIRKGHLVSIAVLDGYKHMGIGTKLIAESIKYLIEYNASELILEVRVSNINAINLYEKKFNFKKIKILNGYYRDGEDAYFMAVKISDLLPLAEEEV
ncbi:MAG: GNAT family N-acetyltransferase [Promethearchaeota archaeon]